MTNLAPLSRLASDQLCARARSYRDMALRAKDRAARASLLRLADRFDAVVNAKGEAELEV